MSRKNKAVPNAAQRRRKMKRRRRELLIEEVTKEQIQKVITQQIGIQRLLEGK